MPRIKPPKTKNLLWKELERKTEKNGLRHTIFSVNGDQYTGEWVNSEKSGKGKYKWKYNGAVYEGDWKQNKRNGFGTYRLPDGKGDYRIDYTGGWKNHKRHGYGTQYYIDDEFYEGGWYANKKSGWGRLFYQDGAIYEGEWYNGQRSGLGMICLANDNRYEGSWRNDMKHGAGALYYLNSGQMFEGVWVDDIPKCGIMKDFGREEAPKPTQYPIPDVTLDNPEKVTVEARKYFMRHQI